MKTNNYLAKQNNLWAVTPLLSKNRTTAKIKKGISDKGFAALITVTSGVPSEHISIPRGKCVRAASENIEAIYPINTDIYQVKLKWCFCHLMSFKMHWTQARNSIVMWNQWTDMILKYVKMTSIAVCFTCILMSNYMLFCFIIAC